MKKENEQAVLPKADTPFVQEKRIHLKQTDSTNEEAYRRGMEGAEEGTVVVADQQTAGRGRRGRSWYSASEDNLYLSLLLRPNLPLERASMITLVAAVAIKRGIEAVCGLRAKIKWPNDLLLGEQKVCGILTQLHIEAGKIGFLVLGIGINVNGKEFPEELEGLATTLQKQLGKAVDKQALEEQLLACWWQQYRLFLAKQNLSFLQEEYNAGLISRGRQVRVLQQNQELSGEALGINAVGELLVQCEDGHIEQIYAGEVSVRGIYGYV